MSSTHWLSIMKGQTSAVMYQDEMLYPRMLGLHIRRIGCITRWISRVQWHPLVSISLFLITNLLSAKKYLSSDLGVSHLTLRSLIRYEENSTKELSIGSTCQQYFIWGATRFLAMGVTKFKEGSSDHKNKLWFHNIFEGFLSGIGSALSGLGLKRPKVTLKT